MRCPGQARQTIHHLPLTKKPHPTRQPDASAGHARGDVAEGRFAGFTYDKSPNSLFMGKSEDHDMTAGVANLSLETGDQSPT